jgi:hypothetical protein
VPSLKKMKDLHVSPDASHPDVRFRRTWDRVVPYFCSWKNLID